MRIIETNIPDVKIIEPKVFKDHRGYFFESFRQDSFLESGINIEFVQDNQSLSSKGTLRGLHFQRNPKGQAKLVRVVMGSVLDVAVDLRGGSPTYGQHIAQLLSAENCLQLFIPVGFAHGFITLEDNTIFQYKCSDYYSKNDEGGLAWNDPDLGINWGFTDPIISEKDQNNPMLKDFVTSF